MYEIFDTQHAAEEYKRKLDDLNSGIRRRVKRNFHNTPSVVSSPKNLSQRKKIKSKKETAKKSKSEVSAKDAAKTRSEDIILKEQTHLSDDVEDALSEMFAPNHNESRHVGEAKFSRTESEHAIRREKERNRLDDFNSNLSDDENYPPQADDFENPIDLSRTLSSQDSQDWQSGEQTALFTTRFPSTPAVSNGTLGTNQTVVTVDKMPLNRYDTIEKPCETVTSPTPLKFNNALTLVNSKSSEKPPTPDDAFEERNSFERTPNGNTTIESTSDHVPKAVNPPIGASTPTRLDKSSNSQFSPCGRRGNFSLQRFVRKRRPLQKVRKTKTQKQLLTSMKSLKKKMSLVENMMSQVLLRFSKNVDACDNPPEDDQLPEVSVPQEKQNFRNNGSTYVVHCGNTEMELSTKHVLKASQANTINKRMSSIIEARLPDLEQRMCYSKSGRGQTKKFPIHEILLLQDLCIQLNKAAPIGNGDSKYVEANFKAYLSTKLKHDRNNEYARRRAEKQKTDNHDKDDNSENEPNDRETETNGNRSTVASKNACKRKRIVRVSRTSRKLAISSDED